MKKKSLLAIIMCVVLILSAAAVHAAEMDTKVSELDDSRVASTGTVSLVRQSALRGKMNLTASFPGMYYDYVKAVVTVERKTSGSWNQYSDPFDVMGDAEYGNMNIAQYINVKDSGTYRIKVYFEDKKGSVTSSTSTYYSQAASL